MNKRPAYITASLMLGLNLLRFNLHGAFDTFYLFLLCDAITWSLALLTLFFISSDIWLRNLFLFAYVLSLNAVNNAAGLHVFKFHISELMFLYCAIAAVLVNTLAPLIFRKCKHLKRSQTIK